MEVLRYSKPAKNWHSALPVGNGFTGVIIYGGKRKEKLCFNDGTLWSGYPKDQDNFQSFQYLNKVRKLIFEGRNAEADALAEKKLIGAYSESFLPLGRAVIKFRAPYFGQYSRKLDIKTAVHSVEFGGTTREAFCSYPDKVTVYRISSKNPISFTVFVDSKMPFDLAADGNTLFMSGNAPDYVAPNYLGPVKDAVLYNEKKGMAFGLGVEAVSDGKVEIINGRIKVTGSRDTVLYFVTATGFVAFNKMPNTSRADVRAKCKAQLVAIDKKYDDIKSRHIVDYSAIYGRQSLKFGTENTLDTNVLVHNARKGKLDYSLLSLFYNYGKYLTIEGSRKGGQPLNLQGIWNNSMRPPWSSNYTVNINTEMNYWAASQSNLAECVEPLICFMEEVLIRGKRTAEVNYGCKGFCCNHNVDLWRKTAPVKGSSCYMLSPLCGVWLSNELFEHYRFGGLDEYKDRIFRITREAARFCVDYLVEKDGEYVICPSNSPENSFRLNAKKCSLDYASAFDTALVMQVFLNCLEAEPDAELSASVKERLSKLNKFKENKYGICEWHAEYDTPESGHRHFSPLYGFYPARIIGYYSNPTEREWIRKLFHYRIDHAVRYYGWSGAWAICLAARLREPDTAEFVIKKMMAHSVFTNLFDVHPPKLFQIDGNFGFVAGINEMLVSTENGVTELLPSWPKNWPDGSVRNMRLHGGAEISFAWKNGEVTELTVNSGTAKFRRSHIAYSVNTDFVD